MLDDGFTDPIGTRRTRRGESQRAQQLDVLIGPRFKAVLVYTPRPAATEASRGSVAIEPMAGITNSMNLAHKGLYRDLQSIPPGGSWEESFWIRPKSF
jgi:aldose 1-epimerase